MAGVQLYSLSDSPPALAVRMLMGAVGLDYRVLPVNLAAGEHLTDHFAKINPQREVPVLDDNGFLLNESVAILQYIADQYSKDESLYPKNPRKRAVVNHRLMFNISTYYKYVFDYVAAPIYFSYLYKRTAEGLKKMNLGLSLFNTYLERGGTKFAASDVITIADFPLVTATMCLEAIDFPMARYPLVVKWYSDFKKERPALWAIAEAGMKEIHDFNKNPPDLSGLNHPLHRPKKH